MNPCRVVLADIDGEGDSLDAYVVDCAAGTVLWVEDLADPSPRVWTLPMPVSSPQEIAAADLNGTGGADAVVSLGYGGLGTFQDGTFSQLPPGAAAEHTWVETGDFDGDGDNDIVSWTVTPEGLEFRENDGLGNFTIAFTLPLGTAST